MEKILKRVWLQITTNRTLMFLTALLIVSILHFLIPIAVFPDSLAYFNLTKILNGVDPVSAWNTVRGPTLPAILYIFTTIFSNTMLGLLIATYVFFIGTMTALYLVINKTLDTLKASSRIKTTVVIAFILLVVLNPVLFGYYHALLTEFVATFLVIMSCLLSWAWLNVDFARQKYRFVAFVVGFAALFIIIWFLKQPYITIVFFPLIIACVLSIIRNFNLANILQRVATMMLCLACLIFCIFVWRGSLVKNGVDLASANGTDDSYLSSGILKGISNTRLIASGDVNEVIVQKDKFLSSAEKEKMTQIMSGKSVDGYKAVQLLDIRSPFGRSIDSVPIYQKNAALSVSESILAWASVTAKHPLVVGDSYLSNYLATVGLYDYRTDLKTGAMTPIKKLGLFGHENSAIGLFYSYHPSNMVANISDQAKASGLTSINNNLGSLLRNLVRSYGRVHCGIFIVVLLLMPLALGLAISNLKKELSRKVVDDKLVHIYELVIIIFGFTLMHTIFNVMLGAMIDRYIYVTIPMAIVGYYLVTVAQIVDDQKSLS